MYIYADYIKRKESFRKHSISSRFLARKKMLVLLQWNKVTSNEKHRDCGLPDVTLGRWDVQFQLFEGTTVRRNTGTYSSNDTVTHSRGPEPSANRP